MNHAHLRAFHAVASEGSFTRAAARLHVTQPTLSGQVKALEETYGVRLFDRRGRRWGPDRARRAFVGGTYPWAVGRGIDLADLSVQRLVLGEQRSAPVQIFETEMARRGLVLSEVLDMNSREALC